MVLTSLEKKEYEKYTSVYDFAEYFKEKTVLITGSRGIIGSGTIKWLLFENKLKNNKTHIIASSRNPKRPSYIENDDNITFCKFGEEGKISEHIDFIIHAAAPTSNKVFMEQPVESIRAIIDGTETILDLARRQKNCSVIYLSSEEVYGTPNEVINIPESFVGAIDSLNVRNCYPLGKKVAENLCISYYEEYGVNVKIIRPSVIFGLFQPYDAVKVEAQILRSIIENKNLFMKSNGMTKKCVIYSMDAISAVLLVLIKGKGGETYNATNPDTFESVKSRASNAFGRFNNKVEIEFAEQDTSRKYGYLPLRSVKLDISRIRELGWKPLASMEDIFEIDIQRFTHNT